MLHSNYKQDCVNVYCLFCGVFKCLLILQNVSYVCRGTADLDKYKSLGYWTEAFAIFTASFTLLKIYKIAPQAEIIM